MIRLFLSKLFLVIFVFLPIILALLYGIINPKNSFLLGRRWQYKNEVEPSEFALDVHRFFSIVILIVVVGLLILLIIS